MEYDFDPDPTTRPSWMPLSVTFYRFGELCMLSKSIIPGFSLKLSHFGLSPHSQFLFKKQALVQIAGLNGLGRYEPGARLSGRLGDVVYGYLESDIFDLA